jgi:DNA/RNA-binding domain of Phe-tRNA-synthetase-like protein
MRRLSFTIADPVFDSFPDLSIHLLRVESLSVAMSRIDPVALLRAAIHRAQQIDVPANDIASYPPIAAWRGAYGALGLQPSKYRSSIENLVRRAVRSSEVFGPPIPAVTLYNACSLETLAPVGGYDVGSLPSDALEFRRADPSRDSFEPLGGNAADFPITDRLCVYASGSTVLCWGFNCRDSRPTALRPDSSAALFVSEAITRDGAIRSESALHWLREHLSAAGADVSVHHSIDSARRTALI